MTDRVDERAVRHCSHERHHGPHGWVLESVDFWCTGTPATYTASEVKVLTETAGEVGRRIGWKAAAEEIAGAIEALQRMSAAAPLAEQLAMGSPHNYLTRAAEIARDVASQAAGATSDATSGIPGHPEVSEAVRSPQEPGEGS